MDEAAFEELYRSAQLRRYLLAEARRHFSCREDQEDVIGLAWSRIEAQPAGEDHEAYRREGARAIKNAYQRRRYRRKRTQALSIDDGQGKPSSALAQLAQIAIRGDW